MATKRRYGSVPVQDYSSFKTPVSQQAALNRQKNILDRNRTSTGAFANQADALNKAGYTLNDTRDKVMSPTGATIAGINKNNNLFSGSRDVSDILKRTINSNPYGDRVANTYNVLDQIYGLDEMSKAGEEKINRVFDAGRGIKFANNPNPADPFRLTASTPTGPQLRFPLSDSTMGEAFGDMRRGLFGGTAPQTIPDLSIANQPRYNQGLFEQGGGIMSMLANVAKPGLGFLINLLQSGGNNMQGGMQKLIDYRPQMIEPRDDGFKGAIDRGSNLFKALLGGTPYNNDNNGVMALPSINNNNIIDETVTTDYGLDDLVLNTLINRRDANTNRAR